jgi:hypothetical protein
MNALVAPAILAKALTRSAVVEPCPIGNDNISKTIGEDGATSGGGWRDRRLARSPAPPCQNGTVACAPLWNGPRLRPAFVAQVLGQVMMDHRKQAAGLARVAYGHDVTQILAALLLDDKF